MVRRCRNVRSLFPGLVSPVKGTCCPLMPSVKWVTGANQGQATANQEQTLCYVLLWFGVGCFNFRRTFEGFVQEGVAHSGSAGPNDQIMKWR